MKTRINVFGVLGQAALASWMANSANGDELELEFPDSVPNEARQLIADALRSQATELGKSVDITAPVG